MQRQLLTKREFAEAIRKCMRSVERSIDSGEIKAIRIGGSVRIPASELDRLTGTGAHATLEPTVPLSVAVTMLVRVATGVDS
ncbi:MAG TPA: helix-turn-helix domain-containing protein [Bryobacteraceae bacterium]|jgi:excisionase family DNA binding protein|nr:helix-turn-helix domain-containing protein [Bryobacteraceae bacterium]